ERLEVIASGSCEHWLGFDREIGPLGCALELKGGCMCAGIVPAAREAAALIRSLRAGIKRLSDEEELCAETTGDDPFSLVYLAAKIAAAEARAAELAKENDRLRAEREARVKPL